MSDAVIFCTLTLVHLPCSSKMLERGAHGCSQPAVSKHVCQLSTGFCRGVGFCRISHFGNHLAHETNYPIILLPRQTVSTFPRASSPVSCTASPHSIFPCGRIDHGLSAEFGTTEKGSGKKRRRTRANNGAGTEGT
jgi:hypothetical protein